MGDTHPSKLAKPNRCDRADQPGIEAGPVTARIMMARERMPCDRRTCGFSLVELVIVVVIIGVIAAIAVPRASRAARGGAEAALQADLSILRGAIEHYAAEHGGIYPSLPDSKLEAQLTQYTDEQGNTSPVKTPPFIYGPYLVSVPTLKVGEGSGSGRGRNKIGTSETSTNGWVYDVSTGDIVANTGTAADKRGTLLKEY